jgi:AraC-like DNA-binding protein
MSPERPSKTLLPARYYALLVELLRKQGVPVDDLLCRLDLDPTRLSQSDCLLSVEQVDALIDAAVSSTGLPYLGFHLGAMIKPSNHEFLGYALMTSATLNDALRLAARYWRLITPAFTLRHSAEATAVRIDLEPALSMQPLTLRFHIEAIATAFHAEISFLLSSATPRYEIQLPAYLATGAQRYRSLAPARVVFGDLEHGGLRILLPAEAVARPLALADRNALKIARNRCEEELSRLTARGSLSEWISLMLDQASDHQPRQQELAAILHISTRTMNRRLAAESTNFRELGLLSRHRRACHLLASGNQPITRIALQLGYKDAANFSRAFRREQGASPIEFRNKRKR